MDWVWHWREVDADKVKARRGEFSGFLLCRQWQPRIRTQTRIILAMATKDSGPNTNKRQEILMRSTRAGVAMLKWITVFKPEPSSGSNLNGIIGLHGAGYIVRNRESRVKPCKEFSFPLPAC